MGADQLELRIEEGQGAEQVAVYEAANQTAKSVKVIVIYTANDERRVHRILRELGLSDDPSSL